MILLLAKSTQKRFDIATSHLEPTHIEEVASSIYQFVRILFQQILKVLLLYEEMHPL